MFQSARDLIDVLTMRDAEGVDVQESIMATHWDLLQNLGQLDLGLTAARNTSVEKFLTSRMRDRLKDEAAVPDKRRERDGANALLAPDLDKLVTEESKVNSKLSQVRLDWSLVFNRISFTKRFLFSPIFGSVYSSVRLQVVQRPYGKGSGSYGKSSGSNGKRSYSASDSRDYSGSKAKRSKEYRCD